MTVLHIMIFASHAHRQWNTVSNGANFQGYKNFEDFPILISRKNFKISIKF